MRILVTGIGGLIGSTFAELAYERGHTVVGIDGDFRGRWFGHEGSVQWRIDELTKRGITVHGGDFRNKLNAVQGMDAIVHCASQPSHDYSRNHVILDSTINYVGTVELLEATRKLAPDAAFVFMSTNKVYGDRVNSLNFTKVGERLIPSEYEKGIPEDYPIDGSLHTPFGVSKTAADLMVQEYRRCFGLNTVTFRCGCLTGPGGTAVEAQGFLGYLVKCAVEGKSYTIYGHEGYQVRDNIDAVDVGEAILRYLDVPQEGVYNLGGGPDNAISVLEVIRYLKKEGFQFEVKYGPERVGDHRWWITNTEKFERDYPGWREKTKGIYGTIDALVQSTKRSRGTSARHAPVASSADEATRVL